MGEPNLLTEDQYFKFWEKFNPESQPFNEIQENLIAIILALAFNVIVAAEIYGYGHSRSGPWLMVGLIVATGICLLLVAWVKKCKRKRFKLWEQWFPYDPEREFPEEYFKQER